jgi:hypothetical protein
LSESDALKGEEFLGVDGVVEVYQVFPEVGDLIEVFEADDGEGRGSEAVFAGILGLRRSRELPHVCSPKFDPGILN